MSARSTVVLIFALLGNCNTSQAEPTAAPPPPARSEAGVRSEVAVAAQRTSTQIRHELLTSALAESEARVHHFTIPLENTKLAFVDLKYQTPLVDALGEHDLVLNGGYWGYRDQRRVIEGLLLVNDQKLAPQHKHGGVLEVREGTARVVRAEDFTPAPNTTLALQCNPRIVDAGQLVPKLEARRRAARTALCVTRDRTRLEAYLTESAITLPELGLFLLQQGCHEALNLDGGPSTAAVARLPQGVLTIARGEALPYGLGFTAH